MYLHEGGIDMIVQSTKEFDAFGPWVYEIGEEHDLPPLFMKYRNLQDSALMMFKIPKQIERRSANPHMHLYDAVVGIFETYVLMLYRFGDSVKEQKINIKDIQAIEVTQALLSGKLKLYTDTRIFTISYNTVSQKVINKAISIIRALQNYPEYNTKLKPMSYSTDTVEHLYVNLLNRLRKAEPDAELIAYQPNIKLSNRKGLSRVFQKKPDIRCTAFVSNKREIIIISRTSAFKKINEVQYSYTYTYLPISKLRSVKRSAYDKDADISMLTMKTDKHSFNILFDRTERNVKALYEELRK